MIPVYIPTFNNPTYVRNMLRQLRSLGLESITLVDSASTYGPMLDLLDGVGCQVIRQASNCGPHLYCGDPLFNSFPDLFVLTDPDLQFNAKLPADFIERLVELTERFTIGKVGFALDISDSGSMRQEDFVLPRGHEKIWTWESQFWKSQVGDVNGNPVYRAVIDTTFAVYNKKFFTLLNHEDALRVGGDYTCNHLPWYQASIVPAEETEFYREHAMVSYYGLS
jgi:hypothetical protein